LYHLAEGIKEVRRCFAPPCPPARTRWTRRPTRRGRRGRAERLQARGIPQGEGKEREKLASGGERWERCKE